MCYEGFRALLQPGANMSLVDRNNLAQLSLQMWEGLVAPESGKGMWHSMGKEGESQPSSRELRF